MYYTGHRGHSVRVMSAERESEPTYARPQKWRVFGAARVCENKLGSGQTSQHGRPFNANDGCQEMLSPWQREAVYFARA